VPFFNILCVYYTWFCYMVFNSQMFNATEVQLWKWCFHIKFQFFMRPIHVWRSRMDQKVQLLKPLN
jgi:hypothetical protein